MLTAEAGPPPVSSLSQPKDHPEKKGCSKLVSALGNACCKAPLPSPLPDFRKRMGVRNPLKAKGSAFPSDPQPEGLAPA